MRKRFPRRAGLTTLAILNIVFAMIGMLSSVALVKLATSSTEQCEQAEQAEQASASQLAGHAVAKVSVCDGGWPANRNSALWTAGLFRVSSPRGYRVMSGLGYLGGVLLLISAFGLLGHRRLLGRQAALAAGVALLGSAGVAMSTQGFLFWGVPMLGAAYTIVLVAITQSAYNRPQTAFA